MLWTLRYFWPEGGSFVFSFYKHWAQLILFHQGGAPVTLLIQEGVTKGDPLLMVLYDITIVPLAEDLRTADTGILILFCAYIAEFDDLAQRSAQLLKLLM